VAEPAKGSKILFWQKNRPSQDAIEGDLNASGMRFGVVVSRWNSFITERLLQGALDGLRRSGCSKEDITVVRVPGAFEIPSQARTLAESGKYDAIVTLGCLIRGETTHYEHISTEVTRGIGQSAQETGVPHTYGVLTCENLEQALDRAGLKAGNKGFEAAISAIEMVSLQRKTQKRPKPKAKSSKKKSKGR
jgi:6,7-dimethyl-8-ribityllumazine synthase